MIGAHGQLVSALDCKCSGQGLTPGCGRVRNLLSVSNTCADLSVTVWPLCAWKIAIHILPHKLQVLKCYSIHA